MIISSSHGVRALAAGVLIRVHQIEGENPVAHFLLTGTHDKPVVPNKASIPSYDTPPLPP